MVGRSIKRRGLANAVVIISLLFVLLVGFLSYAYIGVSQVNYAKKVEEEVRHQALLESELIRIYLWSENRSLNGPPKITLLNAWGRDSHVKYLVVMNKTYEPLREIIFNPHLRVPASSRVDLSPASIGLNYMTFKEMADNIAGIYIYTENGNSFGSTWGYPREENIIGTQTTIALSTTNTTLWHIPTIYGGEATTVKLYQTLPYPDEWDAPTLIVGENVFEPIPTAELMKCQPTYSWTQRCFPRSPSESSECILETFEWATTAGEEKPKAGGPSTFPNNVWRTTGLDVQPMLTWYLAQNPFLGTYTRTKYEYDRDTLSWRPVCSISVRYGLENVELRGQETHTVYVYSGEVQSGTITTRSKVTATYKEMVYIIGGRKTTTPTHWFPTIRQDSVTYTCTLTHTFAGGSTQIVWRCPLDHEPFRVTTTTSRTAVFYPTFNIPVETTFTYVTKIPEGASFTTIVTKMTTIPTYYKEYTTTFMSTGNPSATLHMTLIYVWNQPPTYTTTYRGMTVTYTAPYTRTAYENVQPCMTVTYLAPYTTTFNLSNPVMLYVVTLTSISTMTAQAVEPSEAISGNYTHIYFKLTMPYYKITRNYKIKAIDAEYYETGGEGVQANYTSPSLTHPVCNIVKKTVNGNSGTGNNPPPGDSAPPPSSETNESGYRVVYEVVCKPASKLKPLVRIRYGG